MGFDVAATSYDLFMGRWSGPLAARVVDRLGLEAGVRALDVGCGPGALTALLVERLGAGAVCAVDPSRAFVAAVRERFPEVDVRLAPAERLPFDDDVFDVVVAQLVVHFMADPHGGLAQMARVTRPGGLVAASVWDHAGGRGPLSPFWAAVQAEDPDVPGEAGLVGSRQGQLLELARATGLHEAAEDLVTVTREFASFEEWWEPFTLGVGPAGDHVAGLDERRRTSLRERLRERLGPAPFTLDASAWYVAGRV